MMRSRDCIPANRNRRSRPVVTERLVSFLEHRGAFWIAAPLVGTLGCSLRQESTRMLYADQSLSSHTAEDLPRMAVCDEPPKPFHLTLLLHLLFQRYLKTGYRRRRELMNECPTPRNRDASLHRLDATRHLKAVMRVHVRSRKHSGFD